MKDEIKKELPENGELKGDSEKAPEDIDFKFDLEGEDKIITKGNRLRIAAYCLAFIAAAAVISFVWYNISLSSPAKAVIKAYTATMEEMLASEDIIDKDAVIRLLTETATETDFSLTYNGSAYDDTLLSKLKGSGLTINNLCDPEAMEMGGTIDASVAGMPVNIAEYYADSETVYGCLPLFEKEWIEVSQSNLFSGYNSSALSNHLGRFDYTEDFSVNIFDLYKILDIKGSAGLMEEYLSSGLYSDEENPVFTAFKENMNVIKTGDSFTLDNGKKAKGYSVFLKGADIAAVLNDFADYAEAQNEYLPLAEFFLPVYKLRGGDMTAEEIAEALSSINYEVFRDIAEQIQNEEYEIKVYVYKKRLVRAEAVLNLEFYEGEQTPCRLILSYPSGESITDKITLEFAPENEEETSVMSLRAEITNDGDTVKASIKGNTEFYYAPYEFTLSADYSRSTSDYSVDFNMVNSENSSDGIKFSSDGSFSQAADSMTLKADSLDLYTNGDLMLSVSLSADVYPLEGEIEKPVGETINIFTESDEELMALVNEVKAGYGSLISMAYMFGIIG